MNRAIGYIRVSTDKELQANSLLAQPDAINKYATANGLEVVDIIQDEESAYKVPFFERPGGKRILELIKKSKVQHIIGAKLDRVFRHTQDGLATNDWLLSRDISLHIIDAGGTMNTSTAMGYMFFTMALAMATFEPMRISERTKEALAEMRKNGKKTGRVPYGYKEIDGQLVEVPEELSIIGEIQGLSAAGETLQSIAGKLNDRGVPTKEGGRWHPSTIRNIVKRKKA